MAHTKAKGTTALGRDSKPKYLGIKLSDGQTAKAGSILVRQRGAKILAGKNVGRGKDYTLFATKPGTVQYKTTSKINFFGKKRKAKIAEVN